MHPDSVPSPEYEIVAVPGTSTALIRTIRGDIRGADDPLPDTDAARSTWLYADGPEGPATVLALRGPGGEWAGMVAIVPRRIHMDGREHVGAFLCDFYVHPRHRTLLPALQLQRAARQRLADHATVNYAIPNGRSMPIFKRLGSDRVLQRMRWAKPIRSRKFLTRRSVVFPQLLAPAVDASTLVFDYVRFALAGNFQTEWLTEVDARFDVFWASIPKAGVFIGDRSSTYLRWRFLEEPGHNNRILGIFRRDPAKLSGYIVGKIVQGEFIVRDLLLAPGPRAADLLARALVRLRSLGVDAIGMRVTGDPRLEATLRQLGFRSRDPDVIFVRESLEPACTSCYFTNADEDV